MPGLRAVSSEPTFVAATPRRIAYAPRIALCLLVFAGYYLGAKLGLALTFVPSPVSVLWPPNAILLAALLVVPPRLWWLAVLSALPAHLLAELQGGVPVSMVLCWFVSNVSEALLGASCARWLVRGRVAFATLSSVIAFMVAAFVGVFLTSFLDSAFVKLNHFGHDDYWQVWSTRLFSNITASITLVPLIVTWACGGLAALRVEQRARVLELGAIVLGLLATTVIAFDSHVAAGLSPALTYLPLPLLLWAACRFGPVGASTAFAGVAVLVIWGAGHGLGPLSTGSPKDDVLSVQLFLMFAGPALLCLAAALEERRRAEESLRLSDKRFQLVLQATRDTVYEREIGSDRLWWSGNGLAQFGYARERHRGDFASWNELIHPEDREREREQLAAAIEDGRQLWESEFRLRRADGSYAHVHEQGFIVRDARGEPLQVVGALTDISERRAEDELAQRLAQASRLTAMGELTASIAHELNQPMSAILSNVDAAEMLLDAGEEHSPELREVLRDIRSDDLRASEVIRHIRGLANKRETDFLSLDANELIRSVERLVAPVARRRRIRLVVDLADVPPVRADRIHVQQILLNLVFNGMDAMSEYPEERRTLELGTSNAGGGKVVVSVRDRGHGIAPDCIPRIFDSFFTTKKEGMGLGLSIARKLAEAHGGEIWAENNDEGGATLRFTLLASGEGRAA
ncbi:MAG TPA: MASE1 domain-containing protein [Casimicrobiaceae bacterium]|nr:MASE1 domain-containing protein [Casimicrobiaceae bacterium]